MKAIVEKLFYNPYKAAAKNPKVKTDPSTILLPSTRFIFRSTGGSVSLGKESMIGCNFIFESDQGKISIGDYCYISSGSHLISRSEIKIGSYVTMAWGVYVYDHNSHSLEWKLRHEDILQQNQAHRQGLDIVTGKNWNTVKSAPIFIEDKAWIGFDAVILKGVRVGEGAIVAARSVVINDVEPWTVVAGNPAVVVKRLNLE